MDRHERSALTAALCNVVRDYVAKAEDKISKWVNGELKALTDLVDERFRSLPPPKQGERGEKGDKGDIGDPGPIGPAGESIRGERGEKGDPGDRGEKGERGDPGESTKGEKGDLGERGERGEPGPIGLPGEKGIDGKDGRDGIDGKDGAPGIQGLIGERGERGEKGIDGKDGRDAKDGRDGRDGKDGMPGRDALELEILEGEEGKTYPIGTFVTHRGGLVRFRGANIVQVIVNGYMKPSFTLSDDCRSLHCDVEMTNGDRIRETFNIPVPLYRGSYRAGETYVRGDLVTHNYSTWHCNAESTTVSPSTPNTKDWQIFAKRGTDGKDLRPEEPRELTPIRLK